MTKCQNCAQEFDVSPDDENLCKKLEVPAPTWCPKCRLQRKMSRRNERSLYKATCAKCSKETISMYDKNSPYAVYCRECWWSDAWDPTSYGKDYDFSQSFFEQFKDLSREVPRAALLQKGDIESPYTNYTDHNKNSYLIFNCGFLEDSMYNRWGVSSKNIVDTFSIFDSELLYESQEVKNSHKSIYLILSESCMNSSFLYNCHGCQDCFLSSNLKNKKYCFKNVQYSKEDYEKKVSEIDLGSYEDFQKTLREFREEIIPNALRKYVIGNKLTDSTGDYLFQCKNVRDSFHVSESEDSRHCVDCANLKNCMDAYESAFNCELQYDCHGCNRTSRSKFASSSYDDFDIEYSEFCHNSHHLFGCVGLRSKEYCILNQQYTKEEYEELLPRIKKHMSDMPYTDQKGRIYKYGEFFPPELSPFAYNETLAQEYFPLAKKEVEAQGYKWKESDTKTHSATISPDKLPDNIKDVEDGITKEVIGCKHAGECNHQCTTAFKIIPAELQFYRHMGVPLPRLCPNCRHYERLSQRNPLKLWKRQCMCAGTGSEDRSYKNAASHEHHGKNPCPNEFETSYAPERPETVYCEECYKQEMV